MRLVKTPMTLEQYEAKYPHYQTKLISFSDNEIKEFNNKFHKANGKDIPNKYALLEKYKWVHIKDRYYQIPRVSKLGKAAIALGGAAAIACAVVLPLTLNKASSINLTEEEFKSSLTYYYTNDVNRRYSATFKLEDLDPKLNGGDPKSGKVQVSGENIKLTSSGGKNEETISYYKVKDYKMFAAEGSDPEKITSWSRVVGEDPIFKSFGYALDVYANNFDKFTHKDMVYSCTDIIYAPEENGGKGGKQKLSAELTFNEDKTLKKLHQISVEIDPKNDEEESKDSLDVEFTEIGSHVFHDIDELSIQEEMVLEYVGETYNNYRYSVKSFTGKTINTYVEIECDGTHPFQKFYIESLDSSQTKYGLVSSEILSIVDEEGAGIEGWSVTDSVLNLPTKISESGKKAIIEIQFEKDSDDEWTFIAEQ